MARIQILELPEGSSDDRPPFILVVDQWTSPFHGHAHDWAATVGAQGVLVFEDAIDIPANDLGGYNGIPDGDYTAFAATVGRVLGIDASTAVPDVAGWLTTACRELEKSEAAREQLRQERDAQAETLEQMRAGEEPVTDERIAPTPGQWIWQWNRATPEKRLNMAAQILNGMARSSDCFTQNHEARLADLSIEVERLRAERAASGQPRA